MRKILLGTTNPSKVRRFQTLLEGYPVEFLTLHDLNITEEPEETGQTPEENAKIKAEFYGTFFDDVICNDSGLYFDELPLEDERQPGLHIRTPQGVRLNDDEMIAYYLKLVHQLGGRVLAYYLDGLAVYHDGSVATFQETKEEAQNGAFYMIDVASPVRHEGWPLDSMSVERRTEKYFVEPTKPMDSVETEKEEAFTVSEYRRRLTSFLAEALQL